MTQKRKSGATKAAQSVIHGIPKSQKGKGNRSRANDKGTSRKQFQDLWDPAWFQGMEG
jgi:hypothetical protein